jgi:hypothetical protein
MRLAAILRRELPRILQAALITAVAFLFIWLTYYPRGIAFALRLLGAE